MTLLNKILIAAGIYLILLPILLRLTAFLHRKLLIDRKRENARKNKVSERELEESLPKPLWPRWSERLKFTFKDKRSVTIGKNKESGEPKTLGITNQLMMILIFIAGLIAAIIAAVFFSTIKIMLPLSLILFFTAIGFGLKTASPIIEARENLINRMFEIASSKLGIPIAEANNPSKYVRILEWRDPITASKVEFEVPTSFDQELGAEGFLKQYNQIFGQETAWVTSEDPETGEKGWDREKGIVTLKSVPPLPTMAKWSEHYIDNPAIAWSFFPIALGVSGGVELPNPDGEIENVLGFDLSGEQAKLGKKMGVKVSGTITTSPMVLVAGGTGGGKSLSSDTLVLVKKNK